MESMDDYDNQMYEISWMDNGNNASYYYDYYFDFEESVFEQVLKWFETFFIVPVGVLGNILVLCVLLRKKYSTSSTAIFFSCLAASDSAILITGIYNLLTVRFATKWDCKIFTSLWISFGQLSSCILATIAVERAVSVTYQLVAKLAFTARNAKIIMAIVTFLVFGLNAALIVGYDLGGDNFFEKMYCPTTDAVFSSIVLVYPWIDFCIGFAIPFVVIVICSFVILLKLKWQSALFSKKEENKKISSVTKTLLATNACFLVTLAPSRIYNIVYPITFTHKADFTTFLVFSTVSQANAAANFFLYFLNAPVFRADVRGLLCCKQSSVKGTTTATT